MHQERRPPSPVRRPPFSNAIHHSPLIFRSPPPAACCPPASSYSGTTPSKAAPARLGGTRQHISNDIFRHSKLSPPFLRVLYLTPYFFFQTTYRWGRLCVVFCWLLRFPALFTFNLWSKKRPTHSPPLLRRSRCRLLINYP